MSWASLTLATNADLGALEPEATASDQPWGTSSWDAQLEKAKRDLRVWIDADFPDHVGASDRIRDRWAVPQVLAETGGAFTDYTVEAGNDTEEDVPLASVYATPGSDYLYVGSLFAYSGLFLHLLDSDSTATSALTVAYWGANEWTTMPSVNDGTVATSGQTFGQSGRITWGVPLDWERRSLNNTGEEYYWVRLSIDNALTAATAATQVLAIKAPDALKAIHERLALYHVLNGLERQAANPEEWAEKAMRYRDDAKDLYERIKSQGGIAMDEDLSGAVDEPERVNPAEVSWLRG